MKKFTIIALIAISASTAAYAALPAVLAKVNGKEITKAEVERSFSELVMEQPGQKKLTFETAPADLQQAFLQGYIEKTLVLQEARKAKYQDDPEIQAKVKDRENELVQQKFLTEIVMKKNTEANLRKIYDEKINSKEPVEEIHAYHILVRTEDEAKKVRKSIIDGADFEKVAKFQSIEPGAKINGGDLDYITPEKMTPEFSKAAFAMNKGEISDPVKTMAGWEIIKVVDKRQKKIPTFGEAKTAIKKQLAVDAVEDEVTRLKVAADIEYFGGLGKKEEKPAVKPLIKKVKEDKPKEDKSDDKKPVSKKADDKKVDSDDADSTDEKVISKAPEKKAEAKPAKKAKPTDKDEDDENE